MSGEITKAVATRGASDRDLTASVDYARKLSASDLLPKSYQGKPANVLLAVEYGRSIGLDPVTAIQMTHVVSGKPTASAQLVGALVRRAGHKLRVRGDGTTATCKIIRSDDPEFAFEVTWTLDRAKLAGLLGSNPTWGKYPQAMLKARAITECARDACPEVLVGIQYTADEMGGPAEVIEAQALTPEVAITDDGEVVQTELDGLDEPIDAEVIDS